MEPAASYGLLPGYEYVHGTNAHQEAMQALPYKKARYEVHANFTYEHIAWWLHERTKVCVSAALQFVSITMDRGWPWLDFYDRHASSFEEEQLPSCITTELCDALH